METGARNVTDSPTRNRMGTVLLVMMSALAVGLALLIIVYLVRPM